jgi:transcriptional regulator with XRE-family HTH domain
LQIEAYDTSESPQVYWNGTANQNEEGTMSSDRYPIGSKALHNSLVREDAMLNVVQSATGTDFADALRIAMDEKACNARELARRAAVHMPQRSFDVAEIESFLGGRTLPMPGELDALAHALGVTPDFLLPGGNERSVIELTDLCDGYVKLKLSLRVPITAARVVRTLLGG